MRTAVSQLLGVEYPIIAFSHCRDVVAAVTNAGGFGVLGAVAHSPEQLDIDLAWIDAEVGGRPYGVDLLVPPHYTGAEEGGLGIETLDAMVPDEHRQWLDEVLDRYGVPARAPGRADAPPRNGIGAMRIDPQSMEPLIDVAFAHPISLVASALGPPPAHLVERAHAAGVAVAALAGTVEHAHAHQRAGVDLVVAQGTEAGGHTGEIATMVLVPQVVDAVAPLPVVAAGGIGCGRQIAAALALGAEGVWCGSVWLMTSEAETPANIQAKFADAKSSQTVRSRSITGKPARMLRTAWTDEWDSGAAPATLPMPLQPMLVESAMRRIQRVAHHGGGAQDLATYFVGQVVGSLDSVRPARRVVQDMIGEVADVFERFANLASET